MTREDLTALLSEQTSACGPARDALRAVFRRGVTLWRGNGGLEGEPSARCHRARKQMISHLQPVMHRSSGAASAA